MDPSLAPNPTVPSALVLPRSLPELGRSEKAQALKAAFSHRARAFASCLGLLFIPLEFTAPPAHLALLNARTAALVLGWLLLIRIVTLPPEDARLLKWSNAACLFLLASFALGSFPSSHADTERALQNELISLLLAGAFLLSIPWFYASAVLCCGFYAGCALQFSSAPPVAVWIRLTLYVIIAALVQQAQARLSHAYNKLALTDEARFAVYSEALEAARKSHLRFEKLSNAGKEALLLHARGTILEANSAAQDLLALPRQSLIGKPVEQVLARDCVRFASRPSDAANNALTPIKVVRGDGVQIDALGYNSEIVFPDGAVSVLGLRPFERPLSPACRFVDDSQLN